MVLDGQALVPLNCSNIRMNGLNYLKARYEMEPNQVAVDTVSVLYPHIPLFSCPPSKNSLYQVGFLRRDKLYGFILHAAFSHLNPNVLLFMLNGT